MTKPASSSSRNTAQNRRTFMFMLLLQLAILAVVVGVARYVITSSEENMYAGLEQSMRTGAQAKVARLTAWQEVVTEQLQQLAGRDQVRLFTYEASSRRMNPAELMQSSQRASNNTSYLYADTEQLSEADQIKAQAPLLRRQLVEYADANGLDSITLLNASHKPFLSTYTGQELTEAHPYMEELGPYAMDGVFTIPATLNEQGRIILGVGLPVRAPLYVDPTGQEVVGSMMAFVDVTNHVQEFTQVIPEGAAGESTRIIQISSDGENLEILEAQGHDIISLSDWTLNEDMMLPLDIRTIPAYANHEAREVYNLAILVPNLPLLVEQDIDIVHARAYYEASKRTVIITAALISIMAALILLVLWWWLVGKRERAVAGVMRQLYETVNQQKQILDSVNMTVTDGIVLNDLYGNIAYANQAFAEMAGEDVNSITMKACQNLPAQDIARNLVQHVSAVRQTNRPLTFTEVIPVQGTYRHYRVVCAPYRDAVGQTLGVVSVYHDITGLVTAQERAQNMVNQTVNVFVRAIEAVDPYLRGQSAFTGMLAAALANGMGLEGHAATLRTASNLSQVGMIQLPSRLLTKTGMLTPEERQHLQKHIDFAKDALEGIDFGLPVLEAIVQMHERLDGSGYPNGLSGDQIGIDGRILAVASTFCAVMRPRSYRQARTLEQAMEILSSVPPKFDPRVVSVLDSYLQTEEGQEFLRNLIMQ